MVMFMRVRYMSRYRRRTHRLKDCESMTPEQIAWLEKADCFQNGVGQWILSWKDMGKKLSDVGMPIEADRLRQKFQKKIAPEKTIFLLLCL